MNFEKNNKQKYTFVYRVHEDPKEEKLIELKNYINQFGYKINTEEQHLSQSLNDLMEKIKENLKKVQLKSLLLNQCQKQNILLVKKNILV